MKAGFFLAGAPMVKAEFFLAGEGAPMVKAGFFFGGTWSRLGSF